MELRDLEYFAVVAQHGNVTRASEALGLSPPALSKSLRRLETAVGTRLVERSPRGVKPTAAGRAMLERIVRIRLALADAAREALELGTARKGHIRVGTSQAEDQLVFAAVAALLRESPGVSVQISISSNFIMLEQLAEGALDLVISTLPDVPHEGTRHDLLYRDEFVACARQGHRLARRKRLTIADLAEESWAVPSPEVPHRQWLDAAFRAHRVRGPRVSVEAPAFRARLRLWSSTDLLGVCTKRLLREAGPAFGLVQLRAKALVFPRPVGAIYRKDGYLPPAACRLLALVRQQLEGPRKGPARSRAETTVL